MSNQLTIFAGTSQSFTMEVQKQAARKGLRAMLGRHRLAAGLPNQRAYLVDSGVFEHVKNNYCGEVPPHREITKEIDN